MTPSSKKRLKLTIDGNSYVVEMEDLSESPLQVTVNGQTYQVQLESSDSPEPAAATPTPAAPSVSGPVATPVKRKQTVAPVGAASKEVQAPMPGDIINIMVQPGDEVNVGDQLCSLEAMKMKSAIRSARDGVIATVEVSEGQAVAHGDVIVTFE